MIVAVYFPDELAIDEVAIYPRVLTAKEIQEYFSLGRPAQGK